MRFGTRDVLASVASFLLFLEKEAFAFLGLFSRLVPSYLLEESE
jgi:hypothetical protein